MVMTSFKRIIKHSSGSLTPSFKCVTKRTSQNDALLVINASWVTEIKLLIKQGIKFPRKILSFYTHYWHMFLTFEIIMSKHLSDFQFASIKKNSIVYSVLNLMLSERNTTTNPGFEVYPNRYNTRVHSNVNGHS